jgi:hypothetical protein
MSSLFVHRGFRGRLYVAYAESVDHIMQYIFGNFRSSAPAAGRERVSSRYLGGSMLVREWGSSKEGPWKLLRLGGLVMAVLIGGFPSSVYAEQNDSSLVSDMELPDAPGRGGHSATSNYQSPPQQGSSSIVGTVLDISGATVAGARVTLASQNGAGERVVLSDSKGEFTFGEVAPGRFKVTVTSAGLETFVSNEIRLIAGEKYELPLIELPVARANTDVQVIVTQEELAHEQLKAAEKQRVLGVIPNFYSSYIWKAAPLKPKQKFELALRATTDPIAFLTTGMVAGVEQAHNTFPGYGSGAEGYAKRYGAAYGDVTIGRYLGSAVLPSVFHQDPRYFYRGSGSIRSRALYAIAATFICRGDNGRWQPNYSHVLGNFGAAGISNVYRAPEDRSASLTIRNGFIITGGNAANNLVREFLLRKLTKNVPAYKQGKP